MSVFQIKRKKLLNGHDLYRYSFRGLIWEVETAGTRPVLFDHVLAQHFEGTYLDVAYQLMALGELDEDLEDSYLYAYSSPKFGRVVVALDSPDVMGDGFFVGLALHVGGVNYLVSASPEAPLGLLARLESLRRKLRGVEV